jgi:hypothetical protein
MIRVIGEKLIRVDIKGSYFGLFEVFIQDPGGPEENY